MLSSEEFLQWCGRLSLSQEARQAVERVRSAGPTRREGGGRADCGSAARWTKQFFRNRMPRPPNTSSG